MATEIGAATNHQNLVERLVQFLTANPDLVAAGQAYEKVFDNTIPASGTAIAVRQVTLRAPGLGGTDSIYMGIQSYGDTALDYYNLRLMGGTAFNPGAIPPGGDYWTAFANYSPRVQALLWNQPMPYWFFANGRRFWLVVKVSTIYESAGAGFILPPCPPSQYPYPLAVVGSYRGDVATRWSDVSDRHRGISSPYERSCYLRDPAGRWLGFTVAGGSANESDYSNRTLLPLGCGRYAGGSDTVINQLRDSFSKFPLKALQFVTRETEGRRYLGDFDGAFYVPTLNSGAEDVIVEDGVDHVVFQTAWRSGNPWLYAIRKD
ncbi:hypothetical protein [Pseudomonas aeruginosa]|uniref:hypothetical protein n=2 Tax=Pseudomonas aeruginosa TaxID=287 RepID=UPI001068B7B3|nr:hypothetical protein [Pseudomonas aeruginosa]TEE91497.1 hypothetical protein IPC1490_31520 [Pseudomonas aeruginosa]